MTEDAENWRFRRLYRKFGERLCTDSVLAMDKNMKTILCNGPEDTGKHPNIYKSFTLKYLRG